MAMTAPPRSLNRGRGRWGTASQSRLGVDWRELDWIMLGAAILSKTRLKRDYLDNQWDNGADGMMFKYERIYVLTQTINPTTRVVDPSIVPENPKIPQSTTSPPGVAVTNLGSNPEIYRWHWLVEGGRDADNYRRVRDTLRR
mgnify:CR=1 FL=1